MKLAPGNPAVPFATVDVEGHPVSLEQFRGRPLLLMFFRYASCPMCNLRLHDFSEVYPRLQARGLSAVAFFHSSARAIKRNAGRRSDAFPLVADPNQEIYRAFGVESSWAGLLKSMLLPSFYRDWIRSMRRGFWGGADLEMAKMPADFLVGPDGRLLLVHYGRDIGDHLSLAEIEMALAELSTPSAAIPSA
ncbi:MAG TPA: peroxiredoxin-like family protein [Thermoanaerobaculia bacterium]|nr:peroxiredoxin-like family protein [Thermoanaerobaculia bacterium]